MADPFSIGIGIVGVISLAIQLTQTVARLGLDWKDAPHDVKIFMVELQSLRTVLSAVKENIVQDPVFADAFENRSSLLLSQLGPTAPSSTDPKEMLQACERGLTELLAKLTKAATERRVGWEHIKGAFQRKKTRELVENLHRQYQVLHSIVGIDTAVLVATSNKEIREMRREQQKWYQDDRVRDLLAWLTTADYGSQQSGFLNQHQPGTGQWLLDSDAFQTWCDGVGVTLFCTGEPGVDKTALTSIVIDYLCAKYNDNNSVGVAYIYCNYRRQDEQKSIDLLASLLQTLIREQRHVPDSLISLFEHHKRNQTRPSVDEISQELIAIVGAFSKCYILIDALDECSNADGCRTKLLSELFNLQSKAGVNLLAISRPIPQIEAAFIGKSTSFEIRASNEDIRRYLEGQMLRLPSFVSRSVALQEEIKNQVVKAVDGIFLLARFHLDSLIGSKSIKALRKALGTLPSGLDGYDRAYRDIMDRIKGQSRNSQDLAMQALTWITCAPERHLTTLELRHALAVETGEAEFDTQNLTDIEDIVSVCEGLVVVDVERDILRMVHYTAQEFFNRMQGELFPEAHNDITAVCVTYLSYTTFQSGICQSSTVLRQLNPLYGYAARNWECHAHGASTKTEQLTLRFLDNEAKISVWAQAMDHNLRGRFGKVRGATGPHVLAYFGLTQILELLVKHGKDEIVELLVATEAVEVNPQDEHGCTPLQVAAREGQDAVVKLLLELGDIEADTEDFFGQTLLSLAAELWTAEVVELLLMQPDVEADLKDDRGITPLTYAITSGNLGAVKLFLRRDDVKALSVKEYDEWRKWAYAHEKWRSRPSALAIQDLIRALLVEREVQLGLGDTGA